jgi:hypothetical protein
VRVLKKHGRAVDAELGEVDVSADETGDEDAALSACYAAAASGTELFGARAGSPALRLVDPSRARPQEPVAIAYGVNVHAAVRVHGNDRAQLERLCRYLARLSTEIRRWKSLSATLGRRQHAAAPFTSGSSCVTTAVASRTRATSSK